MNPSVSSIRVVPAAGEAVTGVGKYRYIARIAEGGMADVYLAVTQSAGFEKLVVIKQLRDSLAEDPSFVTMFMDEARLAARLNHPNVVQTLEVGTDLATGLHFIAMEFLEGVAHVRLARLKERVPPPLAFSLRILIDVLRGLHYAHDLCDFDGKPLNVVHRDVSPQNVMLTFAGGVKVLDFGIAKAALAAEQRPGDFKGKLEYMAPEQAEMLDVDRRADVFSVGVMLFEALTRRRLYAKGDDKLQLLVDGDLPEVLELAPATPKRLATICSRAMAHDRDQRYPSADAMADDLEEYLESTSQHVSARDVGTYVADKFASTRAKIGAAIEAQLALFRSLAEAAPETIPLSRIPLDPSETYPPPGSMSPGLLPPLPSASGLSGGWMGSGAGAGAGSGVGAGSGLSAGSGVSVGSGMGNDGTSAVHTIAPVTPSTSAPRGSPGVLVAVLALAAVALLSGLVAIASTRGRPRASATTAPTASPSLTVTPPARPEAIEGAQIDFTIRAAPVDAVIFVDGLRLDTNPAVGTRPRDGAMHVLRIEAPGYEPREESIAFDRSLLVSIELHAITAEPMPSLAPSGRSPRGKAPRVHPPDGPRR